MILPVQCIIQRKYTMPARNVNPIGYYQMMAEPGSSGGAVLNSKMKSLVSMRSD